MNTNKTLLFGILALAAFQYVFSMRIVQPLNMEYPGFETSDSIGYIEATRFILGDFERTPAVTYRLFSPVVPLLAAALTPLTGMLLAYLLLNFFFLLIACVILYYFFCQIFTRKFYAAWAVTWFATAMPVIVWGPTVMVDQASWLAIALVLYSGRSVIMRMSVYALAVLVKPPLVFLVLFSCLNQVFINRQLVRTLISGALALGLVLGAYVWLGLTATDFTSAVSPRHQHPVLALSSLVFAFNFGLPLVAVGYWNYRHTTAIAPESKQSVLYLLVIYMILLLTEFLLFVHATRLIFILYPVIIAGIVLGVQFLACKTRRPDLTFNLIGVFLIIGSNLTAIIYQTGLLLQVGQELKGL